jgi:hypothetical protein
MEGVEPSRDLYLSETFLESYGRGRGVEAGIDVSAGGSRSDGSSEAFGRVRAGRVRAAVRTRKTRGTGRTVFHASALPIGKMRLDAGYIIPDFGIGLVSSARRFAYPFSASHPLYRDRGVRGWTGFYGSFIRGMSVTTAMRRAEFTMFHGRTGEHEEGGIAFPECGRISGFRAGIHLAGLEAGIAHISGGSSSGRSISSVDLTLISGGRRLMMESALSPGCRPSAVWGLSAGSSRFRYGVLGWSVPESSEGSLASFPGLSAASLSSRSGMSAVISGRPARGLSLSTWAEARRKSDGAKSLDDLAIRVETRLRSKRAAMRASVQLRSGGSRAEVPWPSDAPEDYYRSLGTVVSLTLRPGRSSSLTMEARLPSGDSGAGTLVASRGSAGLPWLDVRVYFSAASYGASSGNPRFALYEPSPSGKYPWKSLYGSGKRLKIGFEAGLGPLKASFWALWAAALPVEAGLRLTAAI